MANQIESFLERISSGIQDILEPQDKTHLPKSVVRDMKRSSPSAVNVGRYNNALLTAYLLATDADYRTRLFRSKASSWGRRHWSNPEHSTDGYDSAVLFGVGRALISYREPAETIVTLIQELTGNENLVPRLDCRERRWLRARTKREFELGEEWFETLPLKSPSLEPLLNSSSNINVWEQYREHMRHPQMVNL